MENLMTELTTATPIMNTFLAIAIGLTILFAIIGLITEVNYRISSKVDSICQILFLISLITSILIGYYIHIETREAISQNQYTVQRNGQQLYVKSQSPWLKDGEFQIVGEDDTNLYVKRDGDIYTVTTKLKIDDATN